MTERYNVPITHRRIHDSYFPGRCSSRTVAFRTTSPAIFCFVQLLVKTTGNQALFKKILKLYKDPYSQTLAEAGAAGEYLSEVQQSCYPFACYVRLILVTF
jgi:hypothetical protein